MGTWGYPTTLNNSFIHPPGHSFIKAKYLLSTYYASGIELATEDTSLHEKQSFFFQAAHNLVLGSHVSFKGIPSWKHLENCIKYSEHSENTAFHFYCFMTESETRTMFSSLGSQLG